MEILKDILFMFIGLVDAVQSFLFTEITIPLLNITFSVWQVLGGVFFPVLMVNWLRKKII